MIKYNNITLHVPLKIDLSTDVLIIQQVDEAKEIQVKTWNRQKHNNNLDRRFLFSQLFCNYCRAYINLLVIFILLYIFSKKKHRSAWFLDLFIYSAIIHKITNNYQDQTKIMLLCLPGCQILCSSCFRRDLFRNGILKLGGRYKDILVNDNN